MIEIFQTVGWLELPMQVITWLGSELFFLLFVAYLYWCVDLRLGIQVALILLLSTSLNSGLKLLFASPRPAWVDPDITAIELESSFGLPSAHAQNAVAVGGVIAQVVRHRWLRGLILLLILLIGLSRLYLGVHFLIDVLVGWLVGAGVLLAFKRYSRPVGQWIWRYRFEQQSAIAIMTSGLLLLPSLVIAQVREAWGLPSIWGQPPLLALPGPLPSPLALDTAVAVAGTWLGFVIGVLWLAQRRSLNSGPNQLAWGTRYLIGITVAIALWAGLGRGFPDDTTVTAYGLRYLRYSLIGGWIAAGAPMVFQWVARSPRG